MESHNNKKTILLVDDDEQVIMFVRELLLKHGYHLLIAHCGKEALQTASLFPGEIALLLSDFQMPEMSGVDLAVALTVARPKLKVLLMSGFPDGMLVLNDGWHFLTKPFIPSQLSALVRGLVYPEESSRFLKT